MFGSVLTGVLDPPDHRGAFGGATGPGGHWDAVPYGPAGATGPALLDRLAAIPLTLPDDIDDLLETVAPLHRPEVAAAEGDHRPAPGPAGGGPGGSWRKPGGRGWAGVRRAVRNRRGTPAAWRSPVEGAQASAAASEAERIALGTGAGLSFSTVAAFGQAAQAEAPEVAAARRPLHVPQAEARASGEAAPDPGAGGHGAAPLAAAYDVQALGAAVLPPIFIVFGGAPPAGGAPGHTTLAAGALSGVASAVASPTAPPLPAGPEFLPALPWAALPGGETARRPEAAAARSGEQSRQPDRAPPPPDEPGGGGSVPAGQVVAPAAEKPVQVSVQVGRPSHQEEAATVVSAPAPRPEPVLAATGFRAEAPLPARPALQEEHARSEPAAWSVTQDRAAVPNAFAPTGADPRTQGGASANRDATGRDGKAAEEPRAEPGQAGTPGGAGSDGTGRSADPTGPGNAAPTAAKAASALGKEAGLDRPPGLVGQEAGLLAGPRPGKEGVADDRAAGGIGKEGTAAAELPPSGQALDLAKAAAGSAVMADRPLAAAPGPSPATAVPVTEPAKLPVVGSPLPADTAVALPGGVVPGSKAEAAPPPGQPVPPAGGPGKEVVPPSGPPPAAQALDPVKLALAGVALVADGLPAGGAAAAPPGGGTGTAEARLPANGPASPDPGASGKAAAGPPVANHGAAVDPATGSLPGQPERGASAGQAASPEPGPSGISPGPLRLGHPADPQAGPPGKPEVLPGAEKPPAVPVAAAPPDRLPEGPKPAGPASGPDAAPPPVQPDALASRVPEADAPAAPGAASVPTRGGAIPQLPLPEVAPVRDGPSPLVEPPAPGRDSVALPGAPPPADAGRPDPGHPADAGNGAPSRGGSDPVLAVDRGGADLPGKTGVPGPAPTLAEPPGHHQPEALAPPQAEPPGGAVQPMRAAGPAVAVAPDLQGSHHPGAGPAGSRGEGGGAPAGRQDDPATGLAASATPGTEPPHDSFVFGPDPREPELTPVFAEDGPPAVLPEEVGFPAPGLPTLVGDLPLL